MNEKKEALRLEILKDIEKNSRVDLGRTCQSVIGAEEADVANEDGRDWRKRRSSADTTR